MHKLARYPLVNAKQSMNTTKKASWWKKTGSWTRGCTLHSMKRGTKTRRLTTNVGSNTLLFCGCRDTTTHHVHQHTCTEEPISPLTHIQTAVKLRPVQSHRLKSRKQLTGMKYNPVKQTQPCDMSLTLTVRLHVLKVWFCENDNYLVVL